MRMIIHKTAQLGELVAAAFDKAALYSADPREPPTTRIFATQPHFTEPRSSHE